VERKGITMNNEALIQILRELPEKIKAKSLEILSIQEQIDKFQTT